ncbi:MAG: metallophosphoesterase [Thermoleophilia bacterium]|nr:metallophosphoesterase [Thermoleophilia bacterium]
MTGYGKKATIAAVVAGLGGAGYMLFEAQWLRARRRRLPVPGLPERLEGLRVLHVSDLHAGAPGPAGRAIVKFARAAQEMRPDMVLFTGDMTDKRKTLAPWVAMLHGIEAPLGKFAVLGNHDHGLRKTFLQDLIRRLSGTNGGPGKYEIAEVPPHETASANRRLLSRADIRLLENECATLDARDEKIQICGVDDYQYGYADLPAVSEQLDISASLRILLSHSPDIVRVIPNGDYQLVLAGHTHGGQICIPHPTRGKILLSTSGSTFGDGLYRFPGLIMHVSPGVGTTLLPFRLLSRPEITLLELARAREADLTG